MCTRNNVFFRAFNQTVVLFANQTNLHGIKHILDNVQDIRNNQNKRYRVQSLFSLVLWLSACFIGTAFAIVLMGLIWNRFQTTPTITTIETNNYPIQNVHFPAVTLCNINKVYLPATKNVVQKLTDAGIEEIVVQEFLSNLSKLIIPELIDTTYINTYLMLEKMGYTTEKLMFELMQPCDKLIKTCFWLGIQKPCNDLFRVAKSTSGFCCSFNSDSVKDSLEVNLSNNNNNDNINGVAKLDHGQKYHVYGSGEFVGLYVQLQIEPNEYVANTKSLYGVEILIHQMEDFPRSSDTTAIGQPGHDLSVSVLPSVIVSEDSIKPLPLEQRNCFFQDERILRTTEQYSYQSCITECTVDNIIRICNCIPFYYPEVHLPPFSLLYHQCSLNNVKCLRENRNIFASLQPPNGTHGFNDNILNIGMECNCMPSCSEQRFEVQTISTKRFHHKELITPFLESHTEFMNYTSVNVHFKDIVCIKYRRDMHMTWDGLFASFGGIFGLCLGGSVLSLVEMVYYFTFRFYNCYQTIKSETNEKQLNATKILQDRHNNQISLVSVTDLATTNISYKGNAIKYDNLYYSYIK